jgi:hypothetical protein
LDFLTALESYEEVIRQFCQGVVDAICQMWEDIRSFLMEVFTLDWAFVRPGRECRWCGSPLRVTQCLTCARCGGPMEEWTPNVVKWSVTSGWDCACDPNGMESLIHSKLGGCCGKHEDMVDFWI